MTGSVEWLHERLVRFDLADLAATISNVPDGLRAHPELVFSTDDEVPAASLPVRFALGKLLDRTLRGMFDGPTNVKLDWDEGLGVVIDLLAVFDDREALPLVMMAAATWLQSSLTALGPDRRSLLVDDQVWALLENEWTVRHLQARLKLCRHLGDCECVDLPQVVGSVGTVGGRNGSGEGRCRSPGRHWDEGDLSTARPARWSAGRGVRPFCRNFGPDLGGGLVGWLPKTPEPSLSWQTAGVTLFSCSRGARVRWIDVALDSSRHAAISEGRFAR